MVFMMKVLGLLVCISSASAHYKDDATTMVQTRLQQEPERGIIHGVTACVQCGFDFCTGAPWVRNEPDVEQHYTVRNVVEQWGCDRIPESPVIVRSSVRGAIYVVEDWVNKEKKKEPDNAYWTETFRTLPEGGVVYDESDIQNYLKSPFHDVGSERHLGAGYESPESLSTENPNKDRQGAGGKVSSDWSPGGPKISATVMTPQALAPQAAQAANKVVKVKKIKMTADGEGDWTYENAPNWRKGWPACGGRQQSPVNLNNETLGEDAMADNFKISFGYTPEDQHPYAHAIMKNDGHMLRVNLSEGSFGSVDLGLTGKFDVKELTFHFPSEHTINGVPATGEMQIIHERDGKMAIVSVLLDEGDQSEGAGDFFAKLRFAVFGTSSKGHEMLCHEPINLGLFWKQFGEKYWHYNGSLSQPPCTEGVVRIIMNQRVSVDKDTLDSFRHVFNNNARPVQNGESEVRGPKDWFSEANDETGSTLNPEAQGFHFGAPLVGEDEDSAASAPAPAPVEESTTAEPPMIVDIVPSLVPR